MSKGNINYKYLKRRKSWFRRNLPLVILIAIAAVVIIAGLIIAGIMLSHSGKDKNNNQANQNEQTYVTDMSTEETTVAREVVWVDNKEPESKEQEYIVPEGVYLPYFIKVNRAANCATVYGIDENGEYTIPVKAFATSCGKAGDETIVGENYVTSDKYEWGYMVDGTYGRYAFRISGGYLFHSVPYYSMNKGDLEDGQYNKLGDYASLGCVRMCVRDVKWIYDNCPSGTGVTIYDDEATPGPLGKPDSIKVPEDSAYAGWDPTDPDENNPWNAYSAKIVGAKDVQTKIGQSVDIMTGVSELIPVEMISLQR